MAAADASLQRLFFALWPDAAALDRLDGLAAEASARCGGRRMRRDSLHLTLAFIGAATPGQRELLEAATDGVRAGPFELHLDRLGWWPHNRVLWAGACETPSRQRPLFDAMRDRLATAGFQFDRRPWVPHVTLVRNARGDRLPEFGDPLRWTVREFSLVASRLQPSGARYTVLRRWALRDPADG